MDENWEVVYSTSTAYKAEILKSILEENEIPSVVINKKDSSYMFGEIEVYARHEDVSNAKQIINRFEANE